MGRGGGRFGVGGGEAKGPSWRGKIKGAMGGCVGSAVRIHFCPVITIGNFMYPSAVVCCYCVLLSVVGCSCVLLCVLVC